MILVKWTCIFITILFYKYSSSIEVEKDFAEDTFEEEYGKIIHASVLFRHGDRTPYAPYPFDPYREYKWPEGLSQLTNVGKQRLYDVGKWFRKRYNNLLSGERYWHQDMKMESSDYDRTLMSASCFLAGFYPPTESEQWNNEGLQWQPIPVHSVPLQHDNMISLMKLCESYNYELFSANIAPRFKELFRKHLNFFNYVGMSTGIMFNEHFIVFGFLKLMEVYDSLNVQNQNNLTLPSWAHAVFPEPMTSLIVKLFDIGTYTDKMKRLKAGPFLKSVTSDIQQKVYQNFEQNLHFYSGHDATIATIMHTLNIYDEILPPYGSALIFELRQKGFEYYVTILYRNSTILPPHLLQIPSCNSACSLDDFLYITKPFIPDHWDEECRVQPIITEKLQTEDDRHLTEGQMMILVAISSFILTTMFYFAIERNVGNVGSFLGKLPKQQ